jgi:hypothetical protein
MMLGAIGLNLTLGCHFSSIKVNRHVFSDNVELMFANFVGINFVEPGRSLTRVTLQPLVLMPVQDLVAQRILDDLFMSFECSYYFLLRFLSRIELSFCRA